MLVDSYLAAYVLCLLGVCAELPTIFMGWGESFDSAWNTLRTFGVEMNHFNMRPRYPLLTLPSFLIITHPKPSMPVDVGGQTNGHTDTWCSMVFPGWPNENRAVFCAYIHV